MFFSIYKELWLVVIITVTDHFKILNTFFFVGSADHLAQASNHSTSQR